MDNEIEISSRFEGEVSEKGIVTVKKLYSYDLNEEEYINYIRLVNLKKLLDE